MLRNNGLRSSSRLRREPMISFRDWNEHNKRQVHREPKLHGVQAQQGVNERSPDERSDIRVFALAPACD
jgi:hypothetical protein